MDPLTTLAKKTTEESRKKAGWWWNMFNTGGTAWVAIAGILVPILLGVAMYLEPDVFYGAFNRALVATGLISESQVGTVVTSIDTDTTIDGAPVLSVTLPTPSIESQLSSPEISGSTSGDQGAAGGTSGSTTPSGTSGTSTGGTGPASFGGGNSGGTTSGGTVSVPTTSPTDPQQPTTIFGFGGLQSFTGGGGGMGGSAAPAIDQIILNPDVTPPTLRVYVVQVETIPCTVSHRDAIPVRQGGIGAGECTGAPSNTEYELRWEVGSDTVRKTITVSGSPTIDTTDTGALFLMKKHNMITPVTVAVYDAAGNSASVTYSIRTTVDLTPPTLEVIADEKNGVECTGGSVDGYSTAHGGTGTGSCVGVASDTAYQLSWKAGEDTVKTTISVDGGSAVETNSTTTPILIRTPATSRTVLVTVYDEFDNAASVLYTFTTQPDVTPPTITASVNQENDVPCVRDVATPTHDGSCIGEPSTTPYVLSWDVGTDAVRTTIQVDGGVPTETTDVSRSFTITAYDTSHTVILTTEDAYANRASVSYTIGTIPDTVPPDFSVYVDEQAGSPCTIAQVEGSTNPAQSGSCTGQPSVTRPYVIEWRPAADVASMSVSEDGGQFTPISITGSRPTYMTAQNASKQIIVRAADDAGNTADVTMALTTTDDTTPPDVRVRMVQSPVDHEVVCPFGVKDGEAIVGKTPVKGACAGHPSTPDDRYILAWDVSTDTARVLVKIDGQDFEDRTVDPVTNNTIHIPVAENGSEASVTVTAYDATGNTATVQYSISVFTSWPLLISEVGWGGTKADPDATWIEIYNPSGVDIPLGSFAVSAGSGEGERFNLSGTIAAQSYVIVYNEGHIPFAENTVHVPLIAADLTNVLSSTPKTLQIKHGSELIDTTPTPNLVWPGGTSGIVDGVSEREQPRTMERVTLLPTFDAADVTGWGSNLGLTELLHVGRDGADNEIAGTPGVRNSLSYLLWASDEAPSGTITLTKAHGVYYIPAGSNNTFANNVVVNAEPGTYIVMAPAATLTVVNGKFKLTGVQAGAITVTSVGDALDGGMLDPGAITLPADTTEGWDRWGSIVSGQNGVLELERTHLSNGGKDKFAMIEVFKGVATLIDESGPSCSRPEIVADAKTSITNSASGGIYATEGELKVRCVYIGDYATYGLITNPSVTAPTQTNGEFVRSNNPLSDEVENVMFVGGVGAKAPAIIGARFGEKTWFGINATGNEMNGIMLGNSVLNIPGVTVYAQELVDENGDPVRDVPDNDAIQIFANEIPYIIDNVPFAIGSSGDSLIGGRAKLIVNSDVVFKLRGEQARIDVYGTLITRGLGSNPVFFTSIYDSLAGTNARYPTTTALGSPAAEDWAGLFVHEGSSLDTAGKLVLSGTSISFAGKAHVADLHAPNNARGGIIALANASVTLAGTSIVKDNGLYGLYVTNPGLVQLTDTHFEGHANISGSAAVYFASSLVPDTQSSVKNFVTERTDGLPENVRKLNITCKNNGFENPPNKDIVFSLVHPPTNFELQDTSTPLTDLSMHYCDVSNIPTGGGGGGGDSGVVPVLSIQSLTNKTIIPDLNDVHFGTWSDDIMESDTALPVEDVECADSQGGIVTKNVRVHVTNPDASPITSGQVTLATQDGNALLGGAACGETDRTNQQVVDVDSFGYAYFVVIPAFVNQGTDEEPSYVPTVVNITATFPQAVPVTRLFTSPFIGGS
jgi:hypothetical protein